MTQSHGPVSKSAPITPHPGKSIVFSPRIQFHETWPSGEYDRRGDTATCNKLTPLLAQQIKEELNTFKMVRASRIIFGCTILTMYRRWKFMRHQRSTRISSNAFHGRSNIASLSEHLASPYHSIMLRAGEEGFDQTFIRILRPTCKFLSINCG